MTRSSGSTSSWLTGYFCFFLLYIIHLSAFHYFAGARPAPSKPVPCKERLVEGVVYLLDTDNHLVQHFLGTECHMIRENIYRDGFDNVESESGVFNIGNKMEPLTSVISADDATVLSVGNDYNTRCEAGEPLQPTSHPAKNYIRDDTELNFTTNTETHHVSLQCTVSPDETKEVGSLNSGSKLPLLQQVSRYDMLDGIDMHQLPVASAERRPTALGYSFGGVGLLSTVSHPDQRQVVHRGIDEGPLIESNNNLVLEGNGVRDEAETTLVLDSGNHLVPLWPTIRRYKTQGDFAKEVSSFWDSMFGIGWEKVSEHLKTQPTTTSPVSLGISQSGPYESFTAQSSDDYSAMLGQGDIVLGYPTATVMQDVPVESAGGITTDSYTLSVDNPSFIWSTATIKPTDVTEQSSGQKLISGDFNNLTVASSSRSPSRDFGYVVGIAIVIGFSMAIPVLIFICALSKRERFIWARMINFTRVQPPNVEHGYDSSAANISGVPFEHGSESTNRPDIVLSHGIDSTNRSGVPTRQDIESANRSVASMNRPGGFQRWFGSTSNSSMRKPGVFQRWFGRGSAIHVNSEETPSGINASTRKGRKIHSARTQTKDGTPDPSLILTEVSERLARRQMKELSTVFSIGEEEEAQPNITSIYEEEQSPVSSTRAIASGSMMGTQRQNSTVKRSRQGIPTFDNMNGVGVSARSAVADGNNMREGGQEDESEDSEGSDSREEASRSVRLDGRAGNGKENAKGMFRRVSIRQYLFPTVEDDKHPTGEISLPEGSVFGMGSGTVVREERKPKRDCEPGNCSSGSSIGGDSTLTMSSDGGVKFMKANHQLPMEEHRPRSGDAVHSPGLGMGGDPVLDQLFRTQSAMDATAEGGASAFWVRAKSPGWNNQTISEGGQSSGYFTGSSSGLESGVGFETTSTLADHMKDAGTEGKKAMNGELND